LLPLDDSEVNPPAVREFEEVERPRKLWQVLYPFERHSDTRDGRLGGDGPPYERPII
jgi:hypothetical protein